MKGLRSKYTFDEQVHDAVYLHQHQSTCPYKLRQLVRQRYSTCSRVRTKNAAPYSVSAPLDHSMASCLLSSRPTPTLADTSSNSLRCASTCSGSKRVHGHHASESASLQPFTVGFRCRVSARAASAYTACKAEPSRGFALFFYKWHTPQLSSIKLCPAY